MVARGQGDDLEARFAKASNVVDFIGKPFSPEALQAVVSHVVGKRTSGAEPGRDTLSDADTRASAGVRAAVEEALSRSADAAVAEARAFAARGQALAGDLDAISMSEILEMLAEQGQSGILRVVNTETNARIEIYLPQRPRRLRGGGRRRGRVPARPFRGRSTAIWRPSSWTRCWRTRAGRWPRCRCSAPI